MDRCRCEDYEAAVKKLRFFTVGTYRPDIIDNYDRGEFYTRWVKHAVDYEDLKFYKAKAFRKLAPEELLENRLSKRNYQIEKMWCPFMTPVRK